MDIITHLLFHEYLGAIGCRFSEMDCICTKKETDRTDYDNCNIHCRTGSGKWMVLSGIIGPKSFDFSGKVCLNKRLGKT
ncbi:MAG: hypothetical protein C4522_09060 [Desulfobacteraceae bacterium]|nr:MAG: hypothetical protein C4522_09060 [Desulfobacteraceae bacterium]